jgi:hypothetical protein
MQVALVIALLALLLWTLLPQANHAEVDELPLESPVSTLQRLAHWLQH